MATSNLKHTWTLSIKNDSGSAVVADSVVKTGDAESNFSVTVAIGESVEVDADVVVGNIVSGFLTSNAPVTVYTNSSNGAGGQAFVLDGIESAGWHNSLATGNPFTTDITKFFIDNTQGTKAATVRGGFLLQE